MKGISMMEFKQTVYNVILYVKIVVEIWIPVPIAISNSFWLESLAQNVAINVMAARTGQMNAKIVRENRELILRIVFVQKGFSMIQ